MTPYYQDDAVTIYHADCFDILAGLEPAGMVLTDPPYNIPVGSAFVHGTVVGDGAGRHNDAPIVGWHELLDAPEQAVLIEFGRNHPDAVTERSAAHRAAGFEPWRQYVIVKSTPPPTPRPVFVSSFETATISIRGRRDWYGGGYVPDSWRGRTPNARGNGVHPTQKPVEPFRVLIEAMADPAWTVIDPFAGSGTTLRAAKDLGRQAIGIELEERYCEIAAVRMAQEVLPL